ncbi:hypothetical protein NLG97_g10333 [Lecanicillium saksenae]|uniref:Uncharacterized protein n=1 Tax=Lecanicillium saksenae TaxID=468837 RepID=A0ACC1QFZ0_9HYPO|nr:hypothetical protein NLG97_g10333 [Lecanicillium saksenae]
MKSPILLALAATVLAAPKPVSHAARSACVKISPGSQPGTWDTESCPVLVNPECVENPGPAGAPYPDCCPSFDCGDMALLEAY